MGLRRTPGSTFGRSPRPAVLLAAVLLVAGLPPQAVRGAVSGSFAPTGSMGTVRWVPAAAPLPGGALVAGGQDEIGNPTDSAEVYDPGTGTFGPTGSMGTLRHGAAAAPLPGGRVLVAGGIGGSMNFLSTAEVYDPLTGTFGPTGSLGTPRYKAAAAPLPDGKILVAGGRTPDNGSFLNLATAEVFDPFTDSFSDTGSMGTPRYAAAAAPLPDGRVLVAGGRDESGTCLSNAEVYDPDTGTFSAAGIGSMGVARSFFAAAPLPGGRVLVAGGDSCSSDLSSAEVYDPDTGTFSDVGSMGGARYGPAAAPLPGGRVLVAGGNDGISNVGTAEVFTLHAFQPDEAIRLGSGKWKGAGVYNEDGTGQTISTKARRDQAKTFTIRVRNDGSESDSFTVEGVGGTPRWVVKYLFAGVNVTSQVEGGTFDFFSAVLGPGDFLNMSLKIKPRSTARIGSKKGVLVSVDSQGDPDAKVAVKAKVTVKSG